LNGRNNLFDLGLWQIVAITVINRIVAILVFALVMAAAIAR
jgi:hypothetical protein